MQLELKEFKDLEQEAALYISSAINGGESLQDVLTAIHAKYFNEGGHAAQDTIAKITWAVKSWDNNFQAARKNPDEFINSFQDQLEEGKSDAERCGLWADFIKGAASLLDLDLDLDLNAEAAITENAEELAKVLREKAADMLKNSPILFASLEEQAGALDKLENANIIIQRSRANLDMRAVSAMLIYCRAAGINNLNLTPEQAAAVSCAAMEEAKIIEAVNNGSLALNIAAGLLALVSLVLITMILYSFAYIGLHVVAGLFGMIAVIPSLISIALLVYAAADTLPELIIIGSEKTVQAVASAVNAFIKTLRALYNYAKRVIIPAASEKTQSICTDVKEFIDANAAVGTQTQKLVTVN